MPSQPATSSVSAADVVRRPPFGDNPLVGARGSDTRRRILAAALDVFDQTAFSEARVEQITEIAGCSRPAFYQYFSSKDDVFWELATQLSHEMVALAKRLEPVGPDEAGLARMTAWVGEFMALHEAWAPVFTSYPAAMRSDPDRTRDARGVASSTAKALVRAVGSRGSAAGEQVAITLDSALIRCSFFAEVAPAAMPREPLALGLARVFHRSLAGPVDGVNLRRGARPGGPRRKVHVPAPNRAPSDSTARSRGERTRQRLLDAGAEVLPARGYHDARVDDIVEQAGVSHGTFYRYFASKDAFFQVLAERSAARMLELIESFDIMAPPSELRAWCEQWFDAYEADGGVISTWQEMRSSPELAAFSQEIGATVFLHLDAQLARRDFGNHQVDASILLALIERAPYNVFRLGFSTRPQAIDALVLIIRRGVLGIED